MTSATAWPKSTGWCSPCPTTCGRSTSSGGIDLARGNGDGTWRLPIPARFVIDREGTIRAVDADPDYTRRPEPARTVEVLRQLGAS